MEGKKLSAIMYIGAGILFCISAFLNGNIVTIPLGAVFIVLGLRKLKDDQ